MDKQTNQPTNSVHKRKDQPYKHEEGLQKQKRKQKVKCREKEQHPESKQNIFLIKKRMH